LNSPSNSVACKTLNAGKGLSPAPCNKSPSQNIKPRSLSKIRIVFTHHRVFLGRIGDAMFWPDRFRGRRARSASQTRAK
jgi:hypothetical protein